MQKTPNLLATFSLARRRSRRDPDQIISRSQREDLLAEIQIISYSHSSEKIFSLARSRSRRDPDQIISRSQQEDLLADKKQISPRSRSEHIQIPARRSSRWQEADLAEIQIKSYPDPSKKIFLLTRSRSRRDPDQITCISWREDSDQIRSDSQREDLLPGKKEKISLQIRSYPDPNKNLTYAKLS